MNRLIAFTIPLLFSFSYLYGSQNGKDSIRALDTYQNAAELIKNGNYTEAIDVLKISSDLREKLYSRKSFNFGVVQNALGVSYRNLGNYEKSLNHFLLAEDAYNSDSLKNELTIARLYNNIGNVYKSKLDLGTALEYFDRAINISIKNININGSDIADYYYNIAEIKFIQKKHKESLDIINIYSQNAYPDTKLYYLGLKAANYQELKLFNEAYISYQDAIKYSREYYSDAELNLTYEYINYSDFLIKNNKLKEAGEVLDQVEELFVQNNISEGIPFTLFLKTKGLLSENLIVETNDLNAFRRQKSTNLNTAVSYYKEGLKSLKMDISGLNGAMLASASTQSLTQSLELIKLIADTYSQISDVYAEADADLAVDAIENALEYYQITTDLIQQARKEIYSDENKIQLSELEEATFHKIIQTAWKASNLVSDSDAIIEFAFSTAERMKASSVFDRLTDQFAIANSLIPDSLSERERTLNYNITALNERLFNLRQEVDGDESEINKADSAIFQLKKQRDELNKYLETNFSEYYEMKYANSMANMKEIQQKLKSNEVLIEYVLDESAPVPEVYAFLLTPDKKVFYKLNSDSTFLGALNYTWQFISNPSYLFTRNDNSIAYCTSAHYLYNLLLHPFEETIKNKKLIIVPDGKLNYVPFEALLTDMPDTTGTVQFNKLPYLIHKNSMNYAYSANLLLKLDKQKKQAEHRLLAFAPEYFSDTVKFINEQLILIPLPGVEREVDMISQEIRSSIFKGEEATELKFREESTNYDILHLAMHAFINDSVPAFSRFAFTQNSETETNNDGWLNTADIYNLDLNARLTVLSACNTGSGNLRKGEGVMSLARGFLYAGCPSIIMSLWEVEDNAGTEIMHSFYRLIKKGRSIDEALRQAKLTYLENANSRLAHPHYWLGYVSIGNSSPLFRSYDYYFFGLLILALVGLTADQIITYRRSGKRRF